MSELTDKMTAAIANLKSQQTGVTADQVNAIVAQTLAPVQTQIQDILTSEKSDAEKIADAMSLRVPEEGSARAVERLRQHPPTGTQPSVIVFDGVVDVEAVRPYLPTMPGWSAFSRTSSLPTRHRSLPPRAAEPATAGSPAIPTP